MSERVILETHDEIAVITMSRPAQRNAMDTAMLLELVSAFEAVVNELSIVASIVKGAGGAFSAGADISETVDKESSGGRRRLFTRLYELTTTFPKPLIAAIEGPCIGGGAELAAACDLRVGGPSARIRFPGAQFGIPVGAARLPTIVGASHARDLLLTARTIDAQEAFRMGFLNRLVATEELLQTARELAQTIVTNPGAAVQKSSLIEIEQLAERTAWENRALRRWEDKS